MKKLLLPVALVACGSPPQKVQTADPKAVAPVVAAAPAAAPTCKRSVFWTPDPTEAAYREQERRESEYSVEDPSRLVCSDEGIGGCIGGEGGHTLDQKREALNQTRADEGVCDTRHRDDLADAILAHSVPAASTRRPNTSATIANTALVSSVLALTPSEQAQLARDGLVVPERLAYDSFTTAYYDVHRGQLPLYVSVDSIMHAVYASHDKLLANLESERSQYQLDHLLGALACSLTDVANEYPPEVAQDLDLYLTVARKLLGGAEIPSSLGKVDQRANDLVAVINAAEGMAVIDLFGRKRKLDTSAFTPRGHYTEGLTPYFRSAMWLSRIEINLVSRDTRASAPDDPDPTETPREDLLALGLADLVSRTGTVGEVASLDQSWRVLAGAREDVSVTDLIALRKQAGITTLDADAPAHLRAAIGDRWQRTVNTSPTPNVPHLPAIATLLGARITPDTASTGEIITGRSQDMEPVELADMLGFDRARAYIKNNSPRAVRQRASARAALAAAPLGDDLYGAWLRAIQTLAQKPVGTTPSFMDTTAFADLRLDTAIASYAQLRHNHVLIAAQAYDQGGCEIPDGYVEPAPATYLALAAYARKGAAAFRQLDPHDSSNSAAYFTRLERLMNVLAQISREELANQPLSEDTRRFLSMIVEERTVGAATYSTTFPVATFDGWYIDLFPTIDDALADPSFIADVATFSRNKYRAIMYLGARRPHLGVFNVNTGGGARLMVGPVAEAFQYKGTLERRATDEDVPSLTVERPWAASYSVGAPATPAFGIAFQRQGAKGGRWGRVPISQNALALASTTAQGTATIELLDHHFTKLAEVKAQLIAGRTDVPLPTVARPIEAIRVRIGTYTRRFDVSLAGFIGEATSDTVRSPVFAAPKGSDDATNPDDE
ncbi:MAG TPA: DUF3160 domain-containing protein [Kofleriaceae bacterium]